MSRIHEALKAAQQQRAEVPSCNLDEGPGVLEQPVGAIPRFGSFVQSPIGKLGPDLLEQQLSSGRAIVTLETLRAKCKAPSWNPDLDRSLFMGESKHYHAAEEFRTLRSRLAQYRQTAPLKTVLVASAAPGEGKSFVSWNLAQVLAAPRGNSVLLIDADLRRAQLHTYVGMRLEPGLTDYLSGTTDEFGAIQRCPLGNLYFMSAGKPVPEAAELVGSDKFTRFLQSMRETFDWIVIDSPPCVPISDATRIAESCDGVVFVLLANHTPIDVAQRGSQMFKTCPILGVVLNQVEAPEHHASSYYYNYMADAEAG